MKVILSGATDGSRGNLKKIRSPPVSRETPMDDGKFSLEKKGEAKSKYSKKE